MHMKESIVIAFAILAASIMSVAAQPYPSRSTTLIMGLPAGVGTDAIGRTIFEHMKSSLGQPVVVENAPAAGGTVATARAAVARGFGASTIERPCRS
jgi:tripartite-type tricarboxylate transporter receptor subunit TctC